MIATMPGKPVRYTSIPGKGRGLLTARDFAPGETILRESAVLYFPHWLISESDGPADMVRVPLPHRMCIEGLLLQMAPYMVDSEAAARSFASDREMCSLTRSQLISCVALESAFGVRVEGSKTWNASPSSVNADGSSDPSLRTIDAVCPVASLCNHDCAPNAAWVADGPRTLEGVGVRLVAQTAIPAGREICIAYKPSTGSPRASRAGMLEQQYGFACVCSRCVSNVDDTVAFACGACGSGPVRLREIRANGIIARTASCSSCGSAETVRLAELSGARSSISVISPSVYERLLALRQATSSAPLPQLLGQALLHDADVVLFEARYNAIAALLPAPRALTDKMCLVEGGADSDGARVGEFYRRMAEPLTQLAQGVLAFLPHASHYLELFKRKRVLRDAGLALAAVGDGNKDGTTKATTLFEVAAGLEAFETGPGSLRAQLLRGLAGGAPKPADVPAVYEALTSGPI